MVRVMTYNVEYSGSRRPETLDAIARAEADVVLLQEITEPWEVVLRARFAAAYPDMRFHASYGAGGLAVLSRPPIVDEALLPAVDRFPAQRVVVAGVQILHVHLRPMIDGGDPVRGYLTTPPIRRREIEAYARTLTPDPPVIVAGDFNEEPGGQALAFLDERGIHRVDTGEAPTWTWSGSWRGNRVRLALRLDHIAIDARLIARDARVVVAGASDHRPVIATIEPRQCQSPTDAPTLP